MIKHIYTIFFIVFGLFFLASIGVASSDEPLVIPFLSKAPEIDGILESPLWEEEALKFDQFFQLAPKEGGATGKAKVPAIC